MGHYTVVPHPKLKRDYEGRIVRTTRETKNGWGIIPAGVVATITNQSPKGSTITLEPCFCCGLRATISGLAVGDIEFIEQRARCCEHAGCERPAVLESLCQAHYDEWQENKS